MLPMDRKPSQPAVTSPTFYNLLYETKDRWWTWDLGVWLHLETRRWGWWTQIQLFSCVCGASLSSLASETAAQCLTVPRASWIIQSGFCIADASQATDRTFFPFHISHTFPFLLGCKNVQIFFKKSFKWSVYYCSSSILTVNIPVTYLFPYPRQSI